MRENAAFKRIFGFVSDVHYDMHYDLRFDILCDLLCDLPGTLYKDLVNLYPNTCASAYKKLHTTPHF